MAVSDRPWGDFTAADYSIEQWRKACLIDTETGDPNSKGRYKLPVLEPNGTLNRNGCHAAAGGHGLGAVQGVSPAKIKEAAAKLVSLYENQLQEEAPESVEKMAGMSDTMGKAADKAAGVSDMMARSNASRAPIEHLNSNVAEVNFPNRIITVIVTPYDKAAQVPYRGDVWDESFDRSAFSGIEVCPHRVRANREHVRGMTVGKAVSFDPNCSEGLLSEVRIAKTELGNETLALANEEMLSASAGYGVRKGGEHLDRTSMTRRITSAFLDHIAFVESPAFADAQVISVRNGTNVAVEQLPPYDAPNLDAEIQELRGILEWTRNRFKTQ